MAKDKSEFEGETPDQARAQEKREAAQNRAADALKESAKQTWPESDGVVGEGETAASMRSAPPKGRKGSDKTEG